MAEAKHVNIRTVLTMDPEEILENMMSEYGGIEVPDYVSGPEDLDRISQLLSWCINSKSYLSSLEIYLDIATRNAKKSGDKDLHSDMVCRRNIIKTFKDIIADTYTASSRMATIYFEQRKELEEEQRTNNVQYGRSGFSGVGPAQR